jgi:putative transposase
MGHSYTSTLVHCVFSTKDRASTIPSELQEKLWAYLYGIARNHRIEVLAVGGTSNHVHLLIGVPGSMPLSEAINKLKSNSSRWMRDQGIEFGWQEGYGAFSVGASQVPAVKEYIRAQPEHHKKRNFEQEFVTLLEKYGVNYDSDHVFG